MKKFLLLLLLALAGPVFCQNNYYSFNNDSIMTEDIVRIQFDKAQENLPKNYSLTPTIYHRILKGDSLLNFIIFHAQKCDSCLANEFEFTFKQDSVFLLLDKKLPEFTLSDINGNEFSSVQLIGKPALLNYWSTYCGPCVEEIPELNALKEKYGDQMNFIALTEELCSGGNLLKFLEKHPYNFKILQNAGGYKKTLKINSIPRNIFIDSEGYVRSIQSNFPYSELDPENGIKKYDEDNYFVRIIEELIH